MNVISNKQAEYLRADAQKPKRLNLLTGSVSSGKTWISLIAFAFFVASCPPDYEFIMCGKTITSLKRNCLNLLKQQVGKNFKYTISSKTAYLYGRRIWLEGANDERAEGKIRGMTLAGAYCDELTLFPKSFYIMLLSRLRKPGAKLYATTNPDAPTHWVKTEIVDNEQLQPQLSSWHFTLDDNDHNDPQFVTDIKAAYSASPVLWNRYIKGLWTRAEGIIYKAFADNPAAFATATDKTTGLEVIPRFQEINIGVDFGGTASSHAFVCSGFTYGYKTLYALMNEKHSAEGTDSSDIDRMVVEFIDKVISKYGMVTHVYWDNESSVLGRTLHKAILKKYPNISVRPCYKPKIKERIDLLVRLMGLGRFFITRDCQTLSRALQEAVWDTEHENERLDDGSTDIDTLDGFEYSWTAKMKMFVQ